MCSSSFGTNSAVLLHYIANFKPDQKIYFIDTGNHFLETLLYRDKMTNELSLNIEIISACPEVHAITQFHHLWKSNPELCCHLKKVRPLSKIKESYDIWISGLMEWQSSHRAGLDIFENRNGIVKFHPLLDMTEKECISYMNEHHLPIHPMVPLGYDSIGCTHCTKPGNNRMGRWKGHEKTECGMHL